jgi:hypothetical protein
MAAGNHPRSPVTATVTSLTSSQVTVRTTATRTDLFAPVLGVRSSSVNASATVAWGAPSGGTAVLPLAFSWCEWQQQTGGALPSDTTSRVIYLSKTSGTVDCTGPSNNVVPGGFGWLTVNSGSCSTRTSIGNIIASDPGNSVPNGCSTSSFSALLGTTVLLPLFDSYSGSGSGATYRIFGYAAFQLTGYSFGGQYSAGTGTCNGNARCIKGYFTRLVDVSDAFTYDGPVAPQLGASVLKLTA